MESRGFAQEDCAPWEPLVLRARSGDRRAEAQLVEFLASRVRVVLWARTRCHETTKDLAQEVMVHLVRGLRKGQPRDPRALAGFIQGIVRNVVAGHRRSVTRDRLVPVSDVADAPALQGIDELALERAKLVREALAHLSAADCSILVMYLVDAAAPATIGARLGLSAEAVRQRKCRALRQVREEVRRRTSVRPL